MHSLRAFRPKVREGQGFYHRGAVHGTLSWRQKDRRPRRAQGAHLTFFVAGQPRFSSGFSCRAALIFSTFVQGFWESLSSTSGNSH